MRTKWFEIKEQAAGEKRLILLWHIYKLLGKKAVRFITFFVVLITFLTTKSIRRYAQKNLKIIFEYSKENNVQKKIEPNIINAFKNVLNYAYALVDKMEVFSENFNCKKIKFNTEEEKNTLLNDIKEKKGIFFICSHLGNVEVMRSLLAEDSDIQKVSVNVFLSSAQSQIFNKFLNTIAPHQLTKTYPIEEIGLETAIEIEEKLKNGELVFMAGDRLSSGTSNLKFSTKLFNYDVDFPEGTFRFAQMLKSEIYFVCAIKEKNENYRIYLQKPKTEKLAELEENFVRFLEGKTVLYPLQFYHFYDLFEIKE